MIIVFVFHQCNSTNIHQLKFKINFQIFLVCTKANKILMKILLKCFVGFSVILNILYWDYCRHTKLTRTKSIESENVLFFFRILNECKIKKKKKIKSNKKIFKKVIFFIKNHSQNFKRKKKSIFHFLKSRRPWARSQLPLGQHKRCL